MISSGDPPPFVEQSTTAEVLETGIKVVDLLAPCAHGGKIGLFGDAGVGKTVLIQELINNVARFMVVSRSSAASLLLFLRVHCAHTPTRRR